MRHGEAATSNKVAADNPVTEFQEYVEAKGFVPPKVFNCEETGLYWKRMLEDPHHTESLPGHKPMKDTVVWECE